MGKNIGTTRQGVRDLSHIKSHSVGKKIELPESMALSCKHERRKPAFNGFVTQCRDCGETWDVEEDNV